MFAMFAIAAAAVACNTTTEEAPVVDEVVVDSTVTVDEVVETVEVEGTEAVAE